MQLRFLDGDRDFDSGECLKTTYFHRERQLSDKFPSKIWICVEGRGVGSQTGDSKLTSISYFSNIDGNVAYDSLDIRERDEQEKYFDDDEATSMTSPLTSAAASNSSSASDLSFLSPSEFKKLKKLSDDLSPLTLGEPSRGSDANNTENTSGAPVSPSSEERSKKVDGGVAMSNDGDVATT